MKINRQTIRNRKSAVTGSVSRFVVFSLLMILQLILTSEHASAAMIHFNSSAKIQGQAIYLKDVANVLADTEKEQEFLKNIMIAPAPAPGKEMRLSYDTVRSRMTAMGVNLGKIDFSGRSVILVSHQSNLGRQRNQRTVRQNPAQVKRAEKVISEVIEKEIQMKQPNAGFFTVDVQIKPQHAGFILKGLAPGYQIEGLNFEADHFQEVTVRYLDRNSEPQQFPAQCQIISHPLVIVTNYAIPRGQILRESDFTYKQLEKYDPEDSGSYFTLIEDVIGSESIRSIQKGRTITRKDIQEIPLVRANEIVDVVARRGSISISTRMKAKEDGVRGDFITLKSLEGKNFIARVVGLRSTEIDNGNRPATNQAAFNNPSRNHALRITSSSSDPKFNKYATRTNRSRSNQRNSTGARTNRGHRQSIVPVSGSSSRKNSRVRTGNYLSRQ